MRANGGFQLLAGAFTREAQDGNVEGIEFEGVAGRRADNGCPQYAISVPPDTLRNLPRGP